MTTVRDLQKRKQVLEQMLARAQKLPADNPSRKIVEPQVLRCLQLEANGQYSKVDNIMAIIRRALVVLHEMQEGE